LAPDPYSAKDLPPYEHVIIKITNEDVASIEQEIIRAREEQMLRISLEDLENVSSQYSIPVVTITLDDLDKVSGHIYNIGLTKLAPLIKISLDDLPADLNYITTDCYHGTSWASAEQIRKEGFRVGNGTGYGAGIYFSVGAVTIARGFIKSSKPCIIKAKVDWGKVAYLDDPKLPQSIQSAQSDQKTENALKLGYNSFLSISKISTNSPAVGVVLGKRGTYIKPPRIEVVELIDPSKLR
jgi:hypothetical protein